MVARNPRGHSHESGREAKHRKYIKYPTKEGRRSNMTTTIAIIGNPFNRCRVGKTNDTNKHSILWTPSITVTGSGKHKYGKNQTWIACCRVARNKAELRYWTMLNIVMKMVVHCAKCRKKSTLNFLYEYRRGKGSQYDWKATTCRVHVAKERINHLKCKSMN